MIFLYNRKRMNWSVSPNPTGENPLPIVPGSSFRCMYSGVEEGTKLVFRHSLLSFICSFASSRESSLFYHVYRTYSTAFCVRIQANQSAALAECPGFYRPRPPDGPFGKVFRDTSGPPSYVFSLMQTQRGSDIRDSARPVVLRQRTIAAPDK